MYFKAIFAVAMASIVAAQTSSVPESGCGHAIDLIIEACLNLMEPQLKACAAQDWQCMCTQATNVKTCYNNCPSDPRAIGASSMEQSYCNAASAYPSSTSSIIGAQAATTVSSSPGAAVNTGTTVTGEAISSGIATGSSSTPTAVQPATGNGYRLAHGGTVMLAALALGIL